VGREGARPPTGENTTRPLRRLTSPGNRPGRFGAAPNRSGLRSLGANFLELGPAVGEDGCRPIGRQKDSVERLSYRFLTVGR
jgi:hypothetical protein